MKKSTNYYKKIEKQGPAIKKPKLPPIKIIVALRNLVQKLEQITVKKGYDYNMVEIGQISYYLYCLPLEFIPIVISVDKIDLFLIAFSKIQDSKQVLVAIISKIFESHFFASVGNHQKESKKQGNNSQQANLKKKVTQYFDLLQLCLMLNSKQKNPVLFYSILWGWKKLGDWCLILPELKKQGENILAQLESLNEEYDLCVNRQKFICSQQCI